MDFSNFDLIFKVTTELGHVAYQIKGSHKMQQHGSKHFSCRPPYPSPLHPGEGSIGQNSTFLEHGHVAYIKLKGITKCSNMVANVLPADRPLSPMMTLGNGVKRSKFNFSEHGHVAYQIEGNPECHYMVANILPTDSPPPPTLRMWSTGGRGGGGGGGYSDIFIHT